MEHVLLDLLAVRYGKRLVIEEDFEVEMNDVGNGQFQCLLGVFVMLNLEGKHDKFAGALASSSPKALSNAMDTIVGYGPLGFDKELGELEEQQAEDGHQAKTEQAEQEQQAEEEPQAKKEQQAEEEEEEEAEQGEEEAHAAEEQAEAEAQTETETQDETQPPQT